MYQSDFDAVESPASVTAALPPIVATDGERLMRFRRQRDEAALAEVVEAHAAMVWGVCSQVLRRRQDVEDAFQATFLILARKAGSIRAAESAAGWLYRVAFRTSLLVRSQQRRRGEQPLVEEPAASADDQLASLARHEECLTLLEELHALPERYRQPLVLCYFEGKSRREAADELGVTAASVKGLLARGTRMLRTRMVRRGAALSTAMAAASAAMVSAPALAAPQLAGATASLATSFAVKSMLKPIGGAAKTSAAVTLAEKGILAMTLAAAAKPAAVVLAIGLTAGLLGTAAAEKPESRKAPAGASPVLLAEAAPAEQSPTEEAPAADVPVAAPGAEPRAPEPTLSDTPIGLPGPPHADPRDPEPDPWQGMPAQVQQVAEDGEASNKAVNLEIEYWNLKASGLEKKAEAIETKAKVLRTAGKTPMTEILEMEAEAVLTRAEVKLCQSKSLRLKEAIEQRQAARTSTAPPAVQPTMQMPGPTYNTMPAPSEPAAPTPAATPAAAGRDYYYYSPPQPPVLAALPWTPQPAAALPTPSAPTATPQTRVVPAPASGASSAPLNPPVAPSSGGNESPEELKRKFDATRAANPQLSDAGHLYSFVMDRLAERQSTQAWHDPYRRPQPMSESPATLYPASQPALGTPAAAIPAAPTPANAQPTTVPPPQPPAPAPAAQPAAPFDAGKQLTWDALRAANPQVTEEQLLLGLISAAMQASMKPPEMREAMAKLMEENSRLNRELAKHTVPQPAAHYDAEPAEESASLPTATLAARPSPSEELSKLREENAKLKKQLGEAESQQGSFNSPRPLVAEEPPLEAPEPRSSESDEQKAESERAPADPPRKPLGGQIIPDPPRQATGWMSPPQKTRSNEELRAEIEQLKKRLYVLEQEAGGPRY